MAEPIPFDDHIEALKLRSQPKPVTRVNHKVVLLAAGTGILLLFVAASVALNPPKLGGNEKPAELYNTTNKQKAEALALLPDSYDQVQPVAPVLGAPIPGDLGSTIVQTERSLGLEPEIITSPTTDFRASPEQEAQRAARLKAAKLAQESLEAPVFFQIQSATGRTASVISAGAAPVSGFDQSPFSALTSQRQGQDPSGVQGAFGSQNRDPNFQDSKTGFANNPGSDEVYNRYGLEEPRSPYQVMTGTIIPAALISGLNSDLPGTIIAQITEPVYDTATGEHILIPQGSRLIGRYDSRVSFGQSRALVVWDRIIMPDSSSILVDSLPGTDQSGFAGLRDRVDNHFGRLILGVGLATLLGVGTELTFGDDESDVVQAIRDSVQDSTNRAGQRIVDRNLNIQPTLKVRPGWSLRVIVTRDLILRPYQETYSTSRR